MARKSKREMSATELLQSGLWGVDQVAVLLDTPESVVMRWCVVGLLPGAHPVRGVWQIPGAALFFFCQRRIEPHYSVRTAAALLDKEPETIRKWIKTPGMMACVKMGCGKQASVRIPESELLKRLRAEP